ncbi:hypothetical protein JCM10212_004439 [Sporobolomyces blumeae]
MDSQPSAPTTHPLRPYSVSVRPDDFAWSSSTPTPPRPSTSRSTPPSLRYSPRDRYHDSLTDLDHLANDLPSAGALVRAFVTSSLLSFTGVALVQPFEVGKTLAQVQWVPKDGVDLLVEEPELDRDGDRDQDVVENESEAEAYFQDLSSVSQPGFAPPTATSSSSYLAPPPRPTDPAGYLSHRGASGTDVAVRPEWVMPIVVQGGVWDMIKAVGKWKGEGWASLWKGQVATFIYDTISTTLQPTLLSCLTLVFLPASSFSSLPLIYSPRPLPLLFFSTLSHTLTTVFLSPLDLVRTRLIVQSSQPAHRKYSNPISALRTICLEEGGLSTCYLHPNLLWPTVIEGVVRPLLHLATPLIITRYLHLEPSSSPLSFALSEFVLSSASLLVTIPLETIRKRLQIQSRAEFVRAGRAGGVGKPWRSSVEVRPMPYRGMVECLYRILTEETGKIPRRRRPLRRRSSAAPPPRETPDLSGAAAPSPSPFFNDADPFSTLAAEPKEDLGIVGLGASGGLRQLYRGLGMGLGANAVVFLLGLVAGGGNAGGSGWAEM